LHDDLYKISSNPEQNVDTIQKSLALVGDDAGKVLDLIKDADTGRYFQEIRGLILTDTQGHTTLFDALNGITRQSDIYSGYISNVRSAVSDQRSVPDIIRPVRENFSRTSGELEQTISRVRANIIAAQKATQ
jgi:hypothetical protein